LILFGQQSPNSTDYGSRSGQILAWVDPGTVTGTDTFPPTAAHKVPIYLPYGVTDVNKPASVAFYDGRTYIVGGYSANIVIDEAYTAWRQGILPPTEGPSVSGGSGGTGVAYWTFYDELSGERSSLSAGVSVSAESGTRTWTNFPTRPPDDVYIPEGTVRADVSEGAFYTEDPRTRHFYLRPGDVVDIAGISGRRRVTEVSGPRYFVAEPYTYTIESSGLSFEAYPLTRATHIETWIEESGDFPRLVARVLLGTTELVESSTLATRGEAFQDSFQRFPYCTVNTIYHDRQIMAGNPDAPDTVYVSELFHPERYTGLNFRTRNGENVISLLSTRDYCLVLTDKSSYILQGYTDSDFTFTVADPNIGAITHVGNMVIHGYPYIWTQEGPYMYSGAWHPISPENRQWFIDNGPDEFDRAAHDPLWNCWITGGKFVLDYTTVIPQAGGGFAPARLAIDELSYSAPGNWQIVGVAQSTVGYMKERAGEAYGNLYAIYERQTTYSDEDSEPPAGSDRIICRMPGPSRTTYFPNEWWEIIEPV
jgi:hypothetical protein